MAKIKANKALVNELTRKKISLEREKLEFDEDICNSCLQPLVLSYKRYGFSKRS